MRKEEQMTVEAMSQNETEICFFLYQDGKLLLNWEGVEGVTFLLLYPHIDVPVCTLRQFSRRSHRLL